MRPSEYVILYANAATGGQAFDPDYQAVLDFATTNAIALPSASDQAKGNALVSALKASGDWDNIINLLPIKNSNSDFALIDWKRLRLITAYNSPVYGASGYSFNGTNYLRTDELSNIASMQDFSFGLVFTEAITASGYYAGEYNSSAQQMGAQKIPPGEIRMLYQAASSPQPLTGGTRRFITNAGPSTAKFYKEGIEYSSISSVATTPPNRTTGWTIGGINSSSIAGPMNFTCAFAFRGTELNDPVTVDTAISNFIA